jgi:membrane protein
MSKPHIKFDHSKPPLSETLSFTILLSMLWILFSFKEFPCKPNDPLRPLDCLNLSWADFNTTIAIIGPAVTAQLALTIASFAPDETCNTAVREHLSRMRDTAGYIAFGLWGLQTSLALICLLDATSNPERSSGPPLVTIFLLMLTLFLTVVIADTRGQKEWEMEFERLRRQFRYRRRDLARTHKLRPQGERWAAASALREFLSLFGLTCLVPFGLTTVWLKLAYSPPLSMSEILIIAALATSGTSILLIFCTAFSQLSIILIIALPRLTVLHWAPGTAVTLLWAFSSGANLLIDDRLIIKIIFGQWTASSMILGLLLTVALSCRKGPFRWAWHQRYASLDKECKSLKEEIIRMKGMLHSDQCRKTRPREEATGNKIPEASNARGQDVEPRTESKIALFYTIISLLILLTLEILPKLATRGFKTTNLKKPPRDSEGN